MQNRIVEVATDGVHLSLFRGFLKLTKDGEELGRVGFPDIGGLVVRGYGASISLNLVARLAEEKIPVILCGVDQNPASVVWPISTHHGQGHIISAQSTMSQPKKKRLWQALVKAKVTAQAQALEAEGENAADLFEIAKRVRSGDPDNIEAQAARRYWSRMMGSVDPDFRRDQNAGALNDWLNYGYAVLRAGAARSILVAGLHPSLSFHHESRGEALRLASDVMEPFRPWVDLTVRRLAIGGGEIAELSPEHKKKIVRVLSLDLIGPHGASPVQTCMDRLCQSIAQIALGEGKTPELPRGLALSTGGMAV
ncbi:MAG: type II CRISPR-associated endonuclease Cas1 [Pseudomonadota bacterium]